jgi:hypothetical protein
MRNIICLLITLGLLNSCLAQVLPPGNYVITLADGGKALDADPAGMTSNGGGIRLWDNTGANTQVWTVKQVPGNSYALLLMASGKALDADGPGMYSNDGRVQLWDKRPDGYKTQTWKITFAGNNSYTIVLTDGGKALDAGISSMYSNNGIIHLWDKNGGKTQKWTFKPYVANTNTNSTTTISTLTPMSAVDYALWNKAKNDQQGIMGNDFHGFEDLGSACFERQIDTKSECFTSLPSSLKNALISYLITPLAYLVDLFGGGISSINFWYPQHQTSYQPTNLEYYKRTLSGTLKTSHFSDEPCIYLDEDLNLDVAPDPDYNYLISEGHAPNVNVKARVDNATCPSAFDVVESEIAMRQDVKNTFLRMMSTRLTQKISLYGPWIYDDGHCDQPEIHPAEEIWWADSIKQKNYYCNVFCDASKRFWWRDQMDDGLKIKPWGAPPIKGLFAIAFAIPLAQTVGAGQAFKKFEVSNTADYNVVEYADADKTYNLVYGGKTLVSFIPHNDAFKVSFEKIGLLPGTNNMLGGFLVIETSVGTVTQKTTSLPVTINGLTVNLNFPAGLDVNKIDQQYERRVFEKVEGHYLFTVSETDGMTRPIIIKHNNNLHDLNK